MTRGSFTEEILLQGPNGRELSAGSGSSHLALLNRQRTQALYARLNPFADELSARDLRRGCWFLLGTSIRASASNPLAAYKLPAICALVSLFVANVCLTRIAQ